MIQKNNLTQYDEKSDEWWSGSRTFKALQDLNAPRFQFFDKVIPHWNAMKVLDVGCGGGYASEAMAKKGALVTGIDISSKSIAAAKKHAEENGLQIEYSVQQAEKIIFPKETFDIVMCTDVLEHVDSVPVVLKEIYRVLKPGGYFLFDTINRNFLSKAVMIWTLENIGMIPKGTHDWNLFIKPQEMKRYLREAGFLFAQLKTFKVVMYLGAARKE